MPAELEVCVVVVVVVDAPATGAAEVVVEEALDDLVEAGLAAARFGTSVDELWLLGTGTPAWLLDGAACAEPEAGLAAVRFAKSGRVDWPLEGVACAAASSVGREREGTEPERTVVAFCAGVTGLPSLEGGTTGIAGEEGAGLVNAMVIGPEEFSTEGEYVERDAGVKEAPLACSGVLEGAACRGCGGTKPAGLGLAFAVLLSIVPDVKGFLALGGALFEVKKLPLLLLIEDFGD